MVLPVPGVNDPSLDVLVFLTVVLENMATEMAHVIVHQTVHPSSSPLSESMLDEHMLGVRSLIVDELASCYYIPLPLSTIHTKEPADSALRMY